MVTFLLILQFRRYHKQHKTQTIMDLQRKKLDVVVTTFETCRDNVEELNRFKWTAIIADEVHKIKVMVPIIKATVNRDQNPRTNARLN